MYSSNIAIGSASYVQSDILTAQKDNFGHILLTTGIKNEIGEKCGTLLTKIRINSVTDKNKNQLDMNNNEDDNYVPPVPPLFKHKLTLPFTLKIHFIHALDVLMSNITEDIFYRNKIILTTQYENYLKNTVAVKQDFQFKTITAEFIDSDWLFVITDDVQCFEFQLISNSTTLGE